MSDDSSLLVHGLVDRFQRGDRDAFEQLAGRYKQRLLSIIRLRLGSQLQQPVADEDVLQETLLRAYVGRKKFRWEGRARFIAWLTTIAANVCADLVRQKKTAGKRVSLSQLVRDNGTGAVLEDVLPGSSTDPPAALRRSERLRRLEESLAQLSKRHREVIVLSILQCLPTRRVAERMGVTTAAVCMLRARALAKLRALFGNTESLRLPRPAAAPCDLDPPSSHDASDVESPPDE